MGQQNSRRRDLRWLLSQRRIKRKWKTAYIAKLSAVDWLAPVFFSQIFLIWPTSSTNKYHQAASYSAIDVKTWRIPEHSAPLNVSSNESMPVTVHFTCLFANMFACQSLAALTYVPYWFVHLFLCVHVFEWLPDWLTACLSAFVPLCSLCLLMI